MQKKEAIKSFANKEEYQRLVSMLNPKKLVSVYKNLHTGLWSIQQSGRVVCHCNYIVLRDVKFTVRPAGRAKVLKDKQKNIHAFVKGYIVDRPSSVDQENKENWINVSYNPYKFDYFYDQCSWLPVRRAKYADMCVHANSNNLGSPVMAAI